MNRYSLDCAGIILVIDASGGVSHLKPNTINSNIIMPDIKLITRLRYLANVKRAVALRNVLNQVWSELSE